MADRLRPVRMPLEQPLDLAATLYSGQAFRWHTKGGWFVGVVGENVVHLRQLNGALDVVSGPTPADAVATFIRDYLRLEDDLPAIQRAMCVDPYIAEAVRRYPGMRLLRQAPWETLVAFLCSSASNILRVSRSIELLARAYGEPVKTGPEVRYTFPGPERLAWAEEAELRRLGLGFRAPFVAKAARAVAEGKVDLPALRRIPYEPAKEALMRLPGVGEKVADCVLLCSLDKLEAFPIDRWVRRALEEWYLGNRRLSYQELRRWAVDHFGESAGYAEHYLFHRRRLEGH